MTTRPTRYQLPELWMELIDRKRLARLMAIQDVSPAQLAKVAGWSSKTSVTRLLSGEYNGIKDTEKCARIARHLGVGIDDLFMTKISSAAGDYDQKRSA
jgi:transcriptional regulator with XRE-family HTH domain